MFTVIGGILLFNGASRFGSDEAIAVGVPWGALMDGEADGLLFAAPLGVRAARHP